MSRVKVISDAGDLVPLLRAFDSETKRSVFQDLAREWTPKSTVAERYGEEGLDALALLENAHVVETRWAPGDGGPEKAYRSFYTDFHLNMQASAEGFGDLLHMAMLPADRFDELEEQLVTMVGEDGASTRMAREKLELSEAMLRGLVKRSPHVEIKGHQIVRRE